MQRALTVIIQKKLKFGLYCHFYQYILIPRKGKVYGSFFSPGKMSDSVGLSKNFIQQKNAVGIPLTKQNFPSFDTFDEFCVPKRICELIAANFGAEVPTDIQKRTLAPLLERESIAMSSPNNGKTLGYLLPMYLNMQKDRSIYKISTRISRPRAIILLPTRELCVQVDRCCAVFNNELNFQSVIYMGQSRAKRAWNRMRKSEKLLMDVLVTTPKMVLTQIESRRLFLDDLRHIIIDEADILLSRDQQSMTTQILNKVRNRNAHQWLWPVQTQYIFVSSITNSSLSKLLENTFPSVHRISTPSLHAIQRTQKHRFAPFRLAYQKLDYLFYILKLAGFDGNPSAIATSPKSVRPDSINGKSLMKLHSKPDNSHVSDMKRIVIFFSNIATCTSVFYKLQSRGYPADQCHAALPLKERSRVSQAWTERRIPLLCTTDLLSVGIDSQVDVVINYTIPTDVEKYLRRSGRALNHGLVISFYTKSQCIIARAIRKGVSMNKELHSITNWWANYKPTYKEWVQRKRNAISKKLVRLALRRTVPQHLEKAFIAKRGTLQLPWHPQTIQSHGGIPERKHAKIDLKKEALAHDTRKQILSRKKKGSARFGRAATHRFGKSFKRVETGYESTDKTRLMSSKNGMFVGEQYGN